MRQCPKCFEEKSVDQYHSCTKCAGGIQSWCKDCQRLNSLRWAQDPENDNRRYRAHLKHRFKMTPEEYDRRLKDQLNGCAVCGKTPAENGKRLAVDHDHRCCPSSRKTCGRCVRGLLCDDCNKLFGSAQDSVERLGDAIVYLLEWENGQEAG